MSSPSVIRSADEATGRIGQEIGVNEWFQMEQERVNAFAAVSEDHQWIHVDVERAKAESPFGAPIAHGFLTLSLLSHFSHGAVQLDLGAKTLINYGFNKIRFVSPVVVGSRLRAHFVLGAFKVLDGGYEVIWNVSVEVEGRDKPAVVAEWLCRGYY